MENSYIRLNIGMESEMWSRSLTIKLYSNNNNAVKYNKILVGNIVFINALNKRIILLLLKGF